MSLVVACEIGEQAGQFLALLGIGKSYHDRLEQPFSLRPRVLDQIGLSQETLGQMFG